jgi:hypothetical protein
MDSCGDLRVVHQYKILLSHYKFQIPNAQAELSWPGRNSVCALDTRACPGVKRSRNTIETYQRSYPSSCYSLKSTNLTKRLVAPHVQNDPPSE